VHTSIGKTSFTADKLRENASEVLTTLMRLKPSAAKGTYMVSIHLSSTMGPGVRVDAKSAVA
jgi:large subunit ribosomal protein L1